MIARNAWAWLPASVLAMVCLVVPVAAQQSNPVEVPTETETAPEATVTTQAPSLEQAYQREFAFLQTQKRELEARLEAFASRSARERAQLREEIGALERGLIAARAQAERLDGLVFDSEQAVQTARSNVDVLASTLLQADITLGAGFTPPAAEATPAPADFAELFAASTERLREVGQVRRVAGAFFDADGRQLEGEIIEVGEIAAFGVAGETVGALAPAGGGAFKLWDSRLGEASAQALAAGERPSSVGLFIYESLDQEVEAGAEKSVLEIIQSGGLIGWIITLLGLLGVGLVVARILFLRDASASTESLVAAIAEQVARGDREAAIETLKTFKGATARVLTTAIRNLDREREHLEDVISESLLNESTTLNRFGAVILVIAAVSPLLGLLGTVTGMISTFDVITEFGTGDPKLLSGGISIALVTTQLGLIVAIPLLLVGNVLSGWAERIKDEMEKSALHIVNRYIEGRQGQA